MYPEEVSVELEVCSVSELDSSELKGDDDWYAADPPEIAGALPAASLALAASRMVAIMSDTNVG